MDVETITMDPRIAAIHYKDYRKKVREQKAARVAEARRKLTLIETEDQTALGVYRALSKGARILNVASAIRGAGLDPKQRLPVLAIARAHWGHVKLEIDHNRLCFGNGAWLSWSYRSERHTNTKDLIAFGQDLLGAEVTNAAWRRENRFPRLEEHRAQVPSVPVHLRPAGHLEDYCILFDAKWEQVAPPDPILLRHVAGPMYTVLAQWDLSPVEKAVLEGRFA